MHIIIDGYNMIRQSDDLRRIERLKLEEGRLALIRQVALYRRKRGHRITIVFDGWEGGSPQEERDTLEGIDIIYSRLGEKADDVIKRIAQQESADAVIVTSDRGIADFVRRRGKTVISSPEFEEKIRISSMGKVEIEIEEEINDKESQRIVTKKKGPARRLSRTQRNALTTLKKL